MAEIVWQDVIRDNVIKSLDPPVELYWKPNAWKSPDGHFMAVYWWPSGPAILNIETTDWDEAKVQAAAWAAVTTEPEVHNTVDDVVEMPEPQP